ncbi:MAG: phage tail sheath subtilisin-like domain-containing protein [Enhygromyxa sp.]
MAASGPQLGAPGIYRVPPTLAPALAGERLDACAFVGVTARGPAWVPVVDERWRADQPTIGSGRARRRSVARPVSSWSEFVHLYGGLRGPGRLPWAVRAYFDQGGREAWIVRITAPTELDEHGDPEGFARVTLPHLSDPGHASEPAPGAVRLFARDEGSWGNGMRVALGFSRAPLSWIGSGSQPSFAIGDAPPPGSLLRARSSGGLTQLRYLAGLVIDRTARVVRTSLSAPWTITPDELELVTAQLWLDDGQGRRELHRELGLSALHPRFLATVLCHESELAWPDERWLASELEVDPSLPALDRAGAIGFEHGEDRYQAITVDHFFDPDWDPRGERPGSGIAALADAPAVASVVVPDLYHPQVWVDDEPVLEPDPGGSADWEPCEPTPVEVFEQEPNSPTLPHLIRDVDSQLAEIAARQQQVVELAERLGVVALLDVPPGLDQRRILTWRQRFSSSWAAAYHPWLRLARVSEDPQRETPMRLGPAAIAAGIIAQSELRHGVPHGPANQLAVGVVDVEDRVSPRRHDELHPRAINVLLRERDGVRLSAARTLASDPSLRQLSVRRLLQLLRRTLERQLHWVVFEPHDSRLRERVRDLLRVFLRELYRQGAFRGASEQQAFFVRCDADNNPRVTVERGELLVEIGVAPAEPLEFIVLAIRRDGDGQIEVVPR